MEEVLAEREAVIKIFNQALSDVAARQTRDAARLLAPQIADLIEREYGPRIKAAEGAPA